MKKILALAFALTLVLALAGCGAEKVQPIDQTETPIKNNEQTSVLTEPPMMIVANEQTKVEALRGTYSWDYQNTNGTRTAVEADGIHPLGAKEYMTPLTISPSMLDHINPLFVSLQFDAAPDKVSVRYWGEESWEDFGGAESKELEVIVDETESFYSLQLKDGNYIYEVIAEWNNSELYGGTARYSFYTVMNTPDIAEISPSGN